MNLFQKTIGFMAVLCTFSASWALTARPSVRGNVSPRMPTLAGTLYNAANVSVATSATSTGTLGLAECQEAYKDCIMADDVCGPNLTDCTTVELFHGKMGQCMGALSQCNSAAIVTLFGPGATLTNLASGASTVTGGEMHTNFTYPASDSILYTMITGAWNANRYDDATCLRRVTSCLQRDNVCGADFELCTSNKEFKKQRIYCDSTIAKCQPSGMNQLFKNENGTSGTKDSPHTQSRVGEMILSGATLAASNAVSTCYKVADQCILNACADNPFRCMAGQKKSDAKAAQSTSEVDPTVKSVSTSVASVTTNFLNNIADDNEEISTSDVSKFIKAACGDTIGANKYCHITHSGTMPSERALTSTDEEYVDIREEVYRDIYDKRMANYIKPQLAGLITQFDTKAKDKCATTIKNCAMRSCGGGVGSVCWNMVYGSGGNNTIAGNSTRDQIKTGCAALVNTDKYCQYAFGAINKNAVGIYTYEYNTGNAFDKLFPDTDSGTDPLGVIAALDAALATSYNQASIDQMAKQCQNIASSCVRAMCGTDFEGCYRNRTDVMSNLTDTGATKFDNSMNKVGGVLDYTIVLGMCVDTVKNSSVCTEHLAIQAQKVSKANKQVGNSQSWNDASSVRDGWYDAGKATKMVNADEVVVTDENGNELCYLSSRSTIRNCEETGPCESVGKKGCLYDGEKVTESGAVYAQNQAAQSLMRNVLYDLEKEAQAKYNQKLTKEQNMCLAQNNGGVMGNRDNGAAFMWVKLNEGKKVPTNYATKGISADDMSPSNDLYNSFCRMRVTLQSDDKLIQAALSNEDLFYERTSSERSRNAALRQAEKNNVKVPQLKAYNTAYFAVGDTFTCGSWIPAKELDQLAQAVADKSVDTTEVQQRKTRRWMTALGALGVGTGGAFLGDAIANGDVMGGISGFNGNKAKKTAATYFGECVAHADQATKASSWDSVLASARSAMSSANKGVATLRNNKNNEVTSAVTNLETKLSTYYDTSGNWAGATSAQSLDSKTANERQQLANTLNNACNTYNIGKNNDTICSALHAAVCASGMNATVPTTTEQVKQWETLAATAKAGAQATDACSIFATAVETQISVYNASISGYSAVAASAGTLNLAGIKGEIAKLSNACTKAGTTNETDSNRWIGSAVGSTVGAVGGALLFNFATRDIQERQLTAEQQAAYDEFMSEVGNHIKCYIGSEEAGTYGQTIGITLE